MDMEHDKANTAAPSHRPWDEVSLPGAGTDATEQPTILQVLNQVNTVEESNTITGTTSQIFNVPIDELQRNKPELELNNNNTGLNDITDNAQRKPEPVIEAEKRTPALIKIESDSLVSSNSSTEDIKEPSDSDTVSSIKLNQPTSRTKSDSSENVLHESHQQPANVLDIESHLIETCEDYHTNEESVGINELSPIQHELTQGSSKIETDSNVRSVIEVEPAGSRTIQPVQTSVQTQDPKSVAEVINTIIETETETDEVKLIRTQHISDDIKKTADKLVQDIEKEVLAIFRQKVEKKEAAAALPILSQTTETPCIVQENIQSKAQTEDAFLLIDVNTTLSQKVDEQLSEVTSILKGATSLTVNASGVYGEDIDVVIDTPSQSNLCNEHVKIVDFNGLPSPNTPAEKEQRKLFIDSLPHIAEDSDASKLAADCKREYYQSLRKYLVHDNPDRPPIPLQTYRWEDLRRAKERGGYPWTHMYKRPLGPHEEPELVLLLRKSQELRFASESPKSLKKVHYDEQVLVKETERYIQELSEEEEEDVANKEHSTTEDEESHSLQSESISCVSDSVLATGKQRKTNRLGKIRGILKRRKSGRSTEDAQSLPGTSVANSSHNSADNLNQRPKIQKQQSKTPRCFPIMKKLKSMADRQKKRLNIKRISLKKDEKIVLGDETKIIKLKSSPKSERGEIPHFIEKQDSDDVLEIVQLDESPSRKHYRRDDEDIEMTTTSVVEPDEIIEIPNELKAEQENNAQTPEPTVSEILEEEILEQHCNAQSTAASGSPPKKTPRLRREHVYEEIDQGETIEAQISEILEMASAQALKQSLVKQDNFIMNDLESANKSIPLDRMGSSEEEQMTAADANTKHGAMTLMAPISSIDSASSDEDRGRPQLSPVAEESELGSIDVHPIELVSTITEDNEITNNAEHKPSMKKEASPAPSDKKVTFSHVEDEAEPHREDIELPENIREATANRWKNMSDHEYEPIADPGDTEDKVFISKESSPMPQQSQIQNQDFKQSHIKTEELRDEMKEAEVLQKDLEERYFSSETTTPRTESRTDYEIHTSQVDSSALEELPLQPENRKKSFMASAQDRTRKMQAGIKMQAGKIKTKLRSPTKKTPSGSPKAKERKRFKAPEFSKIKMPEIKRPDMTKLKDFKRPEFTKFNKPDLSKFKLPEKFSTLKLRRSKSFKENESIPDDDMCVAAETSKTAEAAPQKKMFDFNFGTYPRAFRKKKKPLEPEASFDTGTGTEEPSVIPSTETQPSMESSSSPQGDRGPGPVRSRWADKFSDVSYNDSEGSRYRRYGSEQESFDRESSMERRMRDDLEEAPSEEANLGILGGVGEQKQFAEFDEENRAIHEISNLRAGEFRRRPMVHQDSDLVSEESKEAVGWTDKEIQKNELLRKAELEAEASYLNYASGEGILQDAQSTASSGKKVVMEEIDDDEFFLRKRGVSEDNVELRQYISSAIREGFDMPINALQHVGSTSEAMEYGDYDVPPPKPRRLQKTSRPEDASQEFETQRSEYEDDISMSQNGSDFFLVPKRPMRKGRSRSKYSIDSQEMPITDQHHEQYFDDDEEYLRPPHTYNKENDMEINNLNINAKEVFTSDHEKMEKTPMQPQAPRRRRRQQHESSPDKDSYINGFGGRSVSNSYLQPPEDVIVYRTEHEYQIPLVKPESYADGASAISRKSRSVSRFDEDDGTSHGADSLAMDNMLKNELEAEHERTNVDDVQEKFIIDMMENDGYAVVRKEHLPKPTPPARRKKFTRSPGERFATMPSMRTKRNSPTPPERPPPPRGYSPADPIPPHRKSALSLDELQNIEDDYEEPELFEHERAESPRNLQTGAIINKMKYRPLPPPPRPPREKRQRGASGKGFSKDDSLQDDESYFDDRDGGGERIATSSTADSYDHNGDFEEDARFVEVEVSTQTDPLPDDFVCEEFEITDDMKVIEPRKPPKTLEDILMEDQREMEHSLPLTEDEQLSRGLQRFRDANQRSLSERSRASSQADRSKSHSRPQTPSAVVIERRVSTPVPNRETKETMLEATLIVRPIDDLDLEEEALRREGLLTDSSQQSKSDGENHQLEEHKLTRDESYEPRSIDLEEAIENLRSQVESERETEYDMEVERTMQESAFNYNRNAELLEQLSYYNKDEEVKEKETVENVKELAYTKNKTAPLYTTESQYEYKEEIKEDPIKYDYERKLSKDRESEKALEMETEEQIALEEPTQPQPPPRRRSTTAIEPTPLTIIQPETIEGVIPLPQLIADQPALPSHITIADLEVERLRVHALQAGQIMVSQLHGTQISSDDLECKSGNLVVNHIELPPGFIEDIVERVRSTERSQLHAAETQTSLHASNEILTNEQGPPPIAQESVPPPKPPRHRDLGATEIVNALPTTLSESEQPQSHLKYTQNLDEATQTIEARTTTQTATAFPTVEYLQSLAPLAFYNLRNLENEDRRRRHHRRSRESSPSEEDDIASADAALQENKPNDQVAEHHRHTARRATSPAKPQSVAQAGRQFLSACSLSLINIINQLTNNVRGEVDKDQNQTTRARHVPTLVVLFILITFGILLFLLSGKSVHHHHWDYFNPPGNDGRLS